MPTPISVENVVVLYYNHNLKYRYYISKAAPDFSKSSALDALCTDKLQ